MTFFHRALTFAEAFTLKGEDLARTLMCLAVKQWIGTGESNEADFRSIFRCAQLRAVWFAENLSADSP